NDLEQIEKTDLFGRLTHRTDLGGKTSTFQYDHAGRMKQMTINGAAQSYAYYNTGLVRSVDRPSGPTATYTYDKVGNRLTENGVRNQTAAYDALGRMISFTSTGGGVPDASVEYGYDAAGNLVHAYSQYAGINN